MERVLCLIMICLFLTGCETKEEISIEDGEKILEEANDIIRESQKIDGFEKAEYEKFNSYASENGLDGTPIYITGKIINKAAQDDELLSFIVEQEDRNKWVVGIPVSDNENEIIDGLINKNVRAFGTYTGFSDKFNVPCIVLVTKDTEMMDEVRIERESEKYAYETVWKFSDYINQTIGNDGSENNDTEITIGQSNALRSAKQYLEIQAFSYNGLIEQLEYEKYTHEEAVYAVDNCGADWNEQAVKSAKGYLDMMAFSREELIEQLQYEGFTYEQAVYGVTENGY